MPAAGGEEASEGVGLSKGRSFQIAAKREGWYVVQAGWVEEVIMGLEGMGKKLELKG